MTLPAPNTGGPQIVLFLRPQGTVLLRKPYYSGTDLVLKLRFMTFGFLKSPFFAHFLEVSTWYLIQNSYIFCTWFGLQNVWSRSLTLVYGICLIGKFVTFCHILSIFSYYTGDSYYLVWFWIRTIPGIVLSEFVLSGDPLYIIT